MSKIKITILKGEEADNYIINLPIPFVRTIEYAAEFDGILPLGEVL